jgi:type II secretion system protein D
LSVDNRGQKRLRSGIFTDVRITSDPRANAVVVSAPADGMGLIAGLIRVLDQIPAPEAQVKVFEVRHGDAAGMADVLGELFGQLSTGDGGATTAGTAGDPLVQMRFSVDQRTNSIIATGVEDDLAVVEAVLLRLDESDVRERQTKVYRLKSSPADAVSSAVNDWLQSERAVEQLSPGETSPFQQVQQEVVVVPEVVSNSLIVSATPRYHEEIRSLLEQLDQRPPMVNIQVLIAEVGLRDADEFGVELGLQDGLLFDRSIVESLLTTTSTFITQDQGTSNTITQDVIQSAPIAPGFNFDSTSPLGNNGGDRALANAANVAGQATSGFQLGRMNNELGYGGLVLSGTSSGVNTLLRALQATRRLEILSRPQIMTLDNQAVYIQVGQQVPRINGRSVNLGVQQKQIRDESVRIILGVTPRISPDGLVVMQIDAIKSEVGSESEGIPISINEVGDVIKSPRIDRIFAQTTVAAVSGQTIVLGGLITRRTEDTHRRVSFLSEIPVLGHLFRYDLENQQRTELLIVLTPRVVTGQADADLIKQVEAARMSWCLSDVIKLHGVSGLRGRRDAWSNDETTTVYPGATSVIAKPIPTPAHTLSPDGDQVPTMAVPISSPDGRVPTPAGHVPQALPITPPGGLTPQLKPAVPPRGASSSIRGSATLMGGAGKKTSRFVNARLKPLCNPNLEAYHRTRLERLP